MLYVSDSLFLYITYAILLNALQQALHIGRECKRAAVEIGGIVVGDYAAFVPPLCIKVVRWVVLL